MAIQITHPSPGEELRRQIAEAKQHAMGAGVGSVVPVMAGHGGGVLGPSEWANATPSPPAMGRHHIDPTFGGTSATALLCGMMRMTTQELSRAGFEIVAIKAAGPKLAIFATLRNLEPVMLVDEFATFPTTELIGKIRTLL